MTAREHLERKLRKVPGGGIAWESTVFRVLDVATDPNTELIDTAVDIVWERLMPTRSLERPLLDVYKRGELIVFRLGGASVAQLLRAAA